MSTLSLVSPAPERKTVSFAPSPTPSSSHNSEFGERVDSPIIASSPTGSDSPPFVFPPSSSLLGLSQAFSSTVDSRPSFQSNNPFLNLDSTPSLSETHSVPEPSASERQDSTSSFHHAFANASLVRGNISINHVTGNSSHITHIDNSRSENFGNVYGTVMNGGYDWRQREAETLDGYGPSSGIERGADRPRQRGYRSRYGTGSMDMRSSSSVESDFHRPTAPGAYASQRRGRWQGYPRSPSSATTLRQQGKPQVRFLSDYNF